MLLDLPGIWEPFEVIEERLLERDNWLPDPLVEADRDVVREVSEVDRAPRDDSSSVVVALLL